MEFFDQKLIKTIKKDYCPSKSIILSFLDSYKKTYSKKIKFWLILAYLSIHFKQHLKIKIKNRLDFMLS